jgi:large subunit ribosomal protein L5
MRLLEKYKKEIVPKLKEKLGINNLLALPKIKKVVVNVGVGRFTKDKAHIDNVIESLTNITGQKPVLCAAKKSISAFKVREGNIVGVKVTLRGQRMYDFIERLVNITFPRIRDFRGISDKIIDRQGNLAIGLKEHLAFPEIKIDEISKQHGLEVCISTTAKNREAGLELFRLLGFPFKKD